VMNISAHCSRSAGLRRFGQLWNQRCDFIGKSICVLRTMSSPSPAFAPKTNKQRPDPFGLARLWIGLRGRSPLAGDMTGVNVAASNRPQAGSYARQPEGNGLTPGEALPSHPSPDPFTSLGPTSGRAPKRERPNTPDFRPRAARCRGGRANDKTDGCSKRIERRANRDFASSLNSPEY